MIKILVLQNNLIASNANSWTAFLPLIVALVVALFALVQMRSNNIMQARIKWIEELKGNISNFMSIMNSINIELINMREEINSLSQNAVNFEIDKRQLVDKHYENIYKNREKVDKYLTLIELSLDSTIKLHVKLNEKLDEFADKARKSYQIENMEDLDSIKKECIQLSREVIKKEWNKARGLYFDEPEIDNL